MADSEPGSILRRKLAAASRAVEAEGGGPGADRSWRLALARAARDAVKLDLEVAGLTLQRMGLTEVLDLVPERALIAVLQGPAESLGVLVLSPEVLASVVEMQTIGKVNRGAPAPRKPTRTDAAMSAGLIDAALEGLDIALEDEADLTWAGGFRYASHLEDARPLGLLLEDADFKVLAAQVSLGRGQRAGQVVLALPAEGRPRAGAEPAPEEPEAAPHHAFAAALADRVEGASCTMLATLARLSLPLGDITALAEGMVLPLRQASIERIRLEGLDGRILGEGRLGQNRGMRAIRLAEKQAVRPQGAQMPNAGAQAAVHAPSAGGLPAPAEPLRAAG